jgi:L-ascorbate metabolism protein UlaG (beta-lactamase superfamily)
MSKTRAALIVLAVVVAGGAAVAYRFLSHPSLAPYASLEMKPSPPTSGGLRTRFFGVSTIQIDDGETAVMTDGFFSRPRLLQSLFSRIAPDPARIDAALKRGNVSKLAAVLVAHSHHDHAMDSAFVAERTGALLVGSASTANIGRGHGLANDRIRIVKHGDTLKFGRFTVEIFESPHSPNPLYTGEITEPLRPPVKGSAYREGGNYAYLLRHDRGTILVQASANFVPGLFRNVKADVVFLGIAPLGKQTGIFVRDYWREVVMATGAKLVIPIHWDDFLRPLDGPLLPMPLLMDDFERGMQMLLKLAETDGVTVRFMPLFEAFDVIR